jgi:hypothetical protein
MMIFLEDVMDVVTIITTMEVEEIEGGGVIDQTPLIILD